MGFLVFNFIYFHVYHLTLTCLKEMIIVFHFINVFFCIYLKSIDSITLQVCFPTAGIVLPPSVTELQ